MWQVRSNRDFGATLGFITEHERDGPPRRGPEGAIALEEFADERELGVFGT